jgi:hypothetical protein
VFGRSDRNYTNRDTPQSCYLDYFRAFGSGLATYETMKWHLKNQTQSEEIQFTSFCELVHRIEKLHRSTKDSVAVVFYQLSGLTTKLSNVVIFCLSTIKHHLLFFHSYIRWADSPKHLYLIIKILIKRRHLLAYIIHYEEVARQTLLPFLTTTQTNVRVLRCVSK